MAAAVERRRVAVDARSRRQRLSGWPLSRLQPPICPRCGDDPVSERRRIQIRKRQWNLKQQLLQPLRLRLLHLV
jgi:hypothetical protein